VTKRGNSFGSSVRSGDSVPLLEDIRRSVAVLKPSVGEGPSFLPDWELPQEAECETSLAGSRRGLRPQLRVGETILRGLKCQRQVVGVLHCEPGEEAQVDFFRGAPTLHPHIHSLITEGVFTPEGEFLALPVPATSLLADIEERFRRSLLQRLNRAERLSEAFLNNLFGWNPSGFSVYSNQLVFDDEPDRLERLTRYLTRAPIAVDAVRTDDDACVEVTTPHQSVTGDTVLQLDPLDWIHAICQQTIPGGVASK